MPPWTILALILGIGFVVLLFAPRFHRRSMQRSRQAMEDARDSRVTEMRASDDAVEFEVESAAVAARLRDVLLLRGVRVEIGSGGGACHIVAHRQDTDVVSAAIEEHRRN